MDNSAHREAHSYSRVLILLAALIATGAMASRLVAQSESKLYYTPCGGGFLEACGEETTYSDCGWSWKGYSLPVFPFVGVIPWHSCDTETHRILYKNYFKSPNETDVM